MMLFLILLQASSDREGGKQENDSFTYSPAKGEKQQETMVGKEGKLQIDELSFETV